MRSERTTRRFYARACCGKVHAPVSMLFPPIDPNERFRERRAAVRRRKRLRRGAAVAARSRRGPAPRHGRAVRRRQRTTRSPSTDLATLAGDAVERSANAAHRASRRPRDDGARIASGQARRVPRSRARRAHRARARREGRERRDRLRHAVGASARRLESAPRATTTTHADAVRRVHERGIYLDRTHRRLRGSGALARAAGPRDPDVRTGRSGATPRGSAGRTRTTGACGSTTSTSPSRRRRRASTRSCSTTCASRRTATWTSAVYRNERSLGKRAGGSRVPALCEEPPRAVRRARLGGGVRAVRGPRPRHRPAPAADGASSRHGLRDDVPVAVRSGRARAPGSERGAGRDRFAGAASFRARAPRPGRSRRALGAGLQLLGPVRASRRCVRRSTRRGSRVRRATCSGTPRVCTRTARSRRPRSYGARRSLRQPRLSRT